LMLLLLRAARSQAGCFLRLIPLHFQRGFRRSLASSLSCWIMLLILKLMGLPSPLGGLSRPLDAIIYRGWVASIITFPASTTCGVLLATDCVRMLLHDS
jgi:hypothetical protein